MIQLLIQTNPSDMLLSINNSLEKSMQILCSPFITLWFGSIGMDYVVSNETILQRNYECIGK